MNSIEKEQYQNVNSSGNASIRNLSYKSPEIPNEVKISSASFNFNQGNVRVPELNLTTGKTDIRASGNIQNFMGFLFTDQKLKGTFLVNSNTFSINDFRVAETSEITEKTTEKKIDVPTGKEAVKIPSFLDTEMTFAVNWVHYDNLVLNNVKGKLLIDDETATFQNVTSNIFDGTIALNGNVSTKNPVSTFKMDLNLNALDIAKSFEGLKLLQALAPIAVALQGKLQTQMNLSGNLNDDLTPQLTSLMGNALAEILTARVQPEKLTLFSKLDEQLNFLDFKDINLDHLKGKVTFKDGMAEITPFNFKIKGININVAGSHSFDNRMNYNLTLDVPAKMLGSEIGGTLAKLSATNIEDMMVALPIGLSGSFQNPKINLNTQQAINTLTQKIIEQQKEAFTQKGLDAISNILKGGKLPPKPADSVAVIPQAQKDSLKTQQEKKVEDVARDIFKGLLGGRKKAQDTIKKN